jgi:predicted DNA-binding protein
VVQTTIKLSKETKRRLDDLGKKGMTYEEIILNLISKVKINVK